jgi:NADH dehydrogenase
MRISLIGGTGFVGQAITKALLDAGHHVQLLVRAGSQNKAIQHEHCTWIEGDLEHETALEQCLTNTEVVIYLVGLLREFPAQGITFKMAQRTGAERTIAIAERLGISRFLLMSANGVDQLETSYQQTKWHAEQALQQSGLQWTIFRPSVIFGDPQGRMEFCTQLKQELIDLPLPAPLFHTGLLPINAGQFKMGPVWIGDVAAAFTTAISNPETHGKIYTLCGPDQLSWKEILTTIAAASGKKKWFVPVSISLLKPVAAQLERFAWFPITRDQLIMLTSGNVCPDNGLQALGIRATPFNTTTLSYLARS